MPFNPWVISALFVAIVTTPSTRAETLSSTTDIAEVSTRATSGFDSNTTQEHDWQQSNESNEQDRQSAEKVVSTVASLVQKYRQDGLESLPKHDHRRRFFLDSPDRLEYENEFYHRDDNQKPSSQRFHQLDEQPNHRQPYQQQQNQQRYQEQQNQQRYQEQQNQQRYQEQQNQQRYQEQQNQHRYQGQQQYQHHRIREETYPVAILGCGHSMNDVSGSFSGANTNFPHQGVLQSWLAGSGWRNSHADDNKYPSQPLQVTTATPKTAPSYRNRDYTRFDFNHQDRRDDFHQSRYKPETGITATREYETWYNSQAQNLPRPAPTWMQPYSQQSYQQRPNRNNRIVYYEYNLEDRRPSRCHPMDRNCGLTAGQYDSRLYGSGSSGQRNRLDDGSDLQSSDEYHHRNQQPYYGRPVGGRTVDSREPQLYDYSDEDYYRYRNDRRVDGSGQNLGFGYVYSVDLPVDRAISPSTAYAYDVEYGKKNGDYRRAPHSHL